MRRLAGALALMFLLLQLNVTLHEQAHAAVCNVFGGCVSDMRVGFFWEYSFVACSNSRSSELHGFAQSLVEILSYVFKLLVVMFVLVLFAFNQNESTNRGGGVPWLPCPFLHRGRAPRGSPDPAQRELFAEGAAPGSEAGVRVEAREG